MLLRPSEANPAGYGSIRYAAGSPQFRLKTSKGAALEILYHYCSTPAFVNIVKKKSIRLSSLSLSNDTREGKLVQALLLERAKKASLPPSQHEQLKSSVELLGSLLDGLGFCLSEEPDLLSQWRGYSDDGAGVSIGFSVDYLTTLSNQLVADERVAFQLEKVQYSQEEHHALIEPVYERVKEEIDAGAFDTTGVAALLISSKTDEEQAADEERREAARHRLHNVLVSLLVHLFKIKGYAFREEREWRLLSHMVRDPADPCEYRATSSRIIPYRTFSLEPILGRLPIARVVLGPKHETPRDVVHEFLRRSGFGDTPVSLSAATYR